MELPNKKRTRMISMKLKDNFYKIVPCDETDKYEQAVEECVKLSRKYAVEFALWFHQNYRNAGINKYIRFGFFDFETIDEIITFYEKNNHGKTS
jgi:hypothetical protein